MSYAFLDYYGKMQMFVHKPQPFSRRVISNFVSVSIKNFLTDLRTVTHNTNHDNYYFILIFPQSTLITSNQLFNFILILTRDIKLHD